MNKAKLEEMNDTQKARIAVAYLIKAKDERPEGLDKFFDKLSLYEKSMTEIMSAIKEAQNSIIELNRNHDQLLGSINSVVEIVSEELPKDKIDGWAKKFEMPMINPKTNDKTDLKKTESIDMAGSTSKQAEPAIHSIPTP